VSDLGEDLARAYEARVAATDVELTPAAIRAVVRQLGGGEGRAQVAAGTRTLAGELGVAVRTVQRWQKEGGEARSVARSTPGLRISVRGVRERVVADVRAGRGCRGDRRRGDVQRALVGKIGVGDAEVRRDQSGCGDHRR